MSQEHVIRGKKVDADVVDLATDDEGLDTEIVGFFDASFPRRKDTDPDTLGERALSCSRTGGDTPSCAPLTTASAL